MRVPSVVSLLYHVRVASSFYSHITWPSEQDPITENLSKLHTRITIRASGVCEMPCTLCNDRVLRRGRRWLWRVAIAKGFCPLSGTGGSTAERVLQLSSFK